ncbi:hypothetical protein ZIOFF_046143 [Zingiber officinale]|uniref:Uncharacterized protein n=1 Tax=Zingiber officinale TaxID=94328 RepID=A0A8J5G1R1_ZINOF|nr:hypothetical protein ZIOFF_046143 [Zingiber officinale]
MTGSALLTNRFEGGGGSEGCVSTVARDKQRRAFFSDAATEKHRESPPSLEFVGTLLVSLGRRHCIASASHQSRSPLASRLWQPPTSAMSIATASPSVRCGSLLRRRGVAAGCDCRRSFRHPPQLIVAASAAADASGQPPPSPGNCRSSAQVLYLDRLPEVETRDGIASSARRGSLPHLALGGHQNAHKKERSTGWWHLNSHLYLRPPPLAPAAFSGDHFRHCQGSFFPVASHSCRPASETVDFLNWQRASHRPQTAAAAAAAAPDEDRAALFDLSLKL